MSVASAAVGLAFGCEMEDIGVRLRLANSMLVPLVVGVCVSRWDMSAGSSEDSGREVSRYGSMCKVSHLNAEPAAAVSFEADPLGTLNSLFAVKWCMMWSLRESKLSLVHFCLSSAVVPPAQLHVSDPSKECALALEPSLAGISVHAVLLTKLIPHSLPL